MPTGWYGTICCICFGGLTTETAHQAPDGSHWDAHRGRCAALAGWVAPEHQAEHDRLVAAARDAEGTGKAWAVRRYYKFIDRITGPEVPGLET